MKSAARWVWNHKRLLVGTSVVAAGAYAGYVAWQKKREFDALCEELLGVQGGARPRTDETRAKEHFDATQQEVNGVVSRELTKVRQQLKRLLDTEALTQELRSGKKFEQAQWNELKVMVWTRLLSSVYALVLLELKLRIHINIVARHYLHETSFLVGGLGAGGAVATGDQLEALLDEVREILQSEPYRIVLADVLNASFEGLHGLLRLKLEAGTATEGAGALPASVPMAKLIPRLSKLLPTVTADDLGANPIAKAVAEVSTLGEFSWMVYTAGPLFAGAQ